MLETIIDDVSSHPWYPLAYPLAGNDSDERADG
jgi:hypothetical protein